MCNEHISKCVGIPIYEEAQLRQNCQPNIVWSENEMMMFAVCFERAQHKPIGSADDVCFRIERRLNDAFDLFFFFGAHVIKLPPAVYLSELVCFYEPWSVARWSDNDGHAELATSATTKRLCKYVASLMNKYSYNEREIASKEGL